VFGRQNVFYIKTKELNAKSNADLEGIDVCMIGCLWLHPVYIPSRPQGSVFLTKSNMRIKSCLFILGDPVKPMSCRC
jgi:hypothetical protein